MSYSSVFLLRVPLAALLLSGVPTVFAGSVITGSLYQDTVVENSVLVAEGRDAVATAGGIHLDSSMLTGSVRAEAAIYDSVGVAGNGASVRLGGVWLKRASVSGSLKDRTVIYDSLALAVRGDASIGGISVENRFDGSASSTTVVGGAVALSLGRFSLFFVPAHIGGIRIH